MLIFTLVTYFPLENIHAKVHADYCGEIQLKKKLEDNSRASVYWTMSFCKHLVVHLEYYCLLDHHKAELLRLYTLQFPPAAIQMKLYW